MQRPRFTYFCIVTKRLTSLTFTSIGYVCTLCIVSNRGLPWKYYSCWFTPAWIYHYSWTKHTSSELSLRFAYRSQFVDKDFIKAGIVEVMKDDFYDHRHPLASDQMRPESNVQKKKNFFFKKWYYFESAVKWNKLGSINIHSFYIISSVQIESRFRSGNFILYVGQPVTFPPSTVAFRMSEML